MTGCEVEDVLRASHIKPWRDASDQERLDPRNGLLLSATLDAL
ncbi:HNH endonuclease signature motif containing protein, partial [Rhodoplanes roseus]